METQNLVIEPAPDHADAHGRISWFVALLRGLVRSRHTGRVVITVDFKEGGIRSARTAHVAREEVVDFRRTA